MRSRAHSRTACSHKASCSLSSCAGNGPRSHLKQFSEIVLTNPLAGSKHHWDLSRSLGTERSTASSDAKPTVRILGTRGIPGGHGGFESFAEDLSQFLVAAGWSVTVYCQKQGELRVWEDEWKGIRLVNISVPGNGSASTIRFDWHATRHSLGESGVTLVLGYNTAVFSLLYRLRGVTSIMNMDGLEWKRGKYGALEKAWFFLNEWLGCWLSNALVADHPSIAAHLATRGVARKTQTITYGSRRVSAPDEQLLAPFGVEADKFALVIARPEPENSILEVVRAFSSVPRDEKLLVLGKYSHDNPYQDAVLKAASRDVVFPGAVYDHATVDALRAYSAVYVHGHTVGGTNPALVEALGAGAPVLAQSNRFNHWVAGTGAAYFNSESECAAQFGRLLGPAAAADRAVMRTASLARHAEAFVLDDRLSDYQALLASWSTVATSPATARAVGTI